MRQPCHAGVTLLPVRHLGGASGRELGRALEQLRPDRVLIEGPPEANPLIRLVASGQVIPPVAVEVSAAEDPDAAFYLPLAAWSSEWIALAWGARRGVPVRWMDLAGGCRLRWPEPDSGANEGFAPAARRAGFETVDAWWDALMTPPRDRAGVFPRALRAAVAARGEDPGDAMDRRREAAMRATIRGVAQGATRVAVVCGAWHAPALVRWHQEEDDAAVASGCAALPVRCRWVAWRRQDLAQEAYGAGVGNLLWEECRATEGDPCRRFVARWLGVIRHGGEEVSACALSETLALAHALAALRGNGSPGWREAEDALGASFSPAVLHAAAPLVGLGRTRGFVG